ncbi:MAG: 23S rRNA (guanosine(2251)-2'-O)-methyltransferase RlmB [Ardenticatenia bacterium]|nr:23S rRNA (guanosine(2251)-2'-O)-methyltransferase RlmB [Ardenticatenia bacterium]
MAHRIFGRHPVREALHSRAPVRRVWVLASRADRGSLEEIRRLAARAGIPVHLVSRAELDRLAGGQSHQGVVAEVAPYRYSTLDAMLAAAAEQGEQPFILVLDHLTDVHNFGALVRTAEAAGLHGVIIPARRSVAVTPTVYKTSAGAVVHMRIAQVPNIAQALRRLAAHGVWNVGLDPQAPHRYDQVDLRGPLSIVVGAEGKGLSRLVRRSCDLLVHLPMRGRVQSLNASVAGAVLIYEALRQRLGGGTAGKPPAGP